MIGNLLTFIGIILMVFPTWLYLKLYTSSSAVFSNRLFHSFRIFRKNDQTAEAKIISYFQYWGLLWLLVGVIGSTLQDIPFRSVYGKALLLVVFLAPLWLMSFFYTKPR